MKPNLFNFSIRDKILLSFTILILIFLGIAAVNYYYFVQIRGLSQSASPLSFKLDKMQDFTILISDVEANLERYFIVGGDIYKEDILEDMESIFPILESVREIIRQETLPDLEALIENTSALNKSILNLLVSESGDLDSRQMNEQIILVYAEIDQAGELSQKITETALEQIHDNVVKQNHIISRMITQSLIISGLVLFFGGLVALSLSKRISGPIKKLRDAVCIVGKGKLDTKIDVKSKDELGELASAFRQMTKNLKESREQIRGHEKELESLVRRRTEEINKKVNELEDTRSAILNILEDVNLSKEQLEKSQKELLKVNRNIKKANVELQKMDKTKNEFISVTAHELKTPLASIHGFAKLLQDKRILGDIKQRDYYLNIIMEDSVRLKKLIDDILDLSRLDLGTMKFVFEKIDVKEIFKNVVKELYLLAAKKGLTLKAGVSNNVPDQITADRSRLTQVIVNLVNNAIKYSPKKGSRIIISASKQGDGYVLFSVQDRGTGIPRKYLKKIFERFYQVDSSYTRKVGGTGLGLSICKGIVEAMGGKIWVSSQVGRGSTFFFTLPIKSKLLSYKEESLQIFKSPEPEEEPKQEPKESKQKPKQTAKKSGKTTKNPKK